ncbi:Growth-regulating factor like [Actinidia chinensis var. chinensis]|uniref:Growth-regulating factor n=1 Tax=Actinidia chinensis var. chinensis TaxID=1590841 RepID=A0A2R6PXK5_ACTCC|nr:Growth-regulating factor like [Actinidia chinensis var. chinensis]
MDSFNLKQWTHQKHESELQQQQRQEQVTSELPLFVPEVLTAKHSDMSAFLPDSTTTSTRSFPKMGSYFSWAQWQELELQALIFRHMLAGACVPPELLNLVKKSLLSSSSSLSPTYYHLPHPLQYYHPALIQSGYWGRALMDPEPGRCRRTDGKKWRCSRDVVAGHKYCERHVHRGRSRSRKPVEIPTPSSAGGGGSSTGGASGGRIGNSGGGVLKTNIRLGGQPLNIGAHFDLSGPSPSIDLLHLNQRTSESRTQNNGPFEAQNEVSGDGKSSGGVLRHFFDDWPRSLHEPSRAQSNGCPITSSTGLSISTPSDPTSDFSLKLSTGNGDGPGHQEGCVRRDELQLNWAGGWGTNQVGPMGGPLAEALRSSSTSNSSPTSVLHQLPRGSASETSYVST